MSPWHVLTAAHVIYPREEPEGWRTIEVGPGYGRGWQTMFRSNGWVVDPLWRIFDCRTDGSDLALIRLAKPVHRGFLDTGDRDYGFWRLAPFAPGALVGQACIVAGYPRTPGDDDCTHMNQSKGQIQTGLTISVCTPLTARDQPPFNATVVTTPITPATLRISHNAISEHSMSGGPIWTGNAGTPTLVALHTGAITNRGGVIRTGVLLTERIQAQIRGWMSGPMRPL